MAPIGNTVCWLPEQFVGVDIPDFAKEYLIREGLPAAVGPSLGFGAPLTRVHAAPFCCWALGSDYEVPLAIGPEGRVLAIESARTARPVNAGVWELGACLRAYARYVAAGSAVGENDAAVCALIDSVETEMRAADAAHLADPEGYWAAMIEQMRDGLL